MAINEQIVTGRKFRKCTDVINKVWQRISFWTKACDVEFDDGETAESKIGRLSFDTMTTAQFNNLTIKDSNKVYFLTE